MINIVREREKVLQVSEKGFISPAGRSLRRNDTGGAHTGRTVHVP